MKSKRDTTKSEQIAIRMAPDLLERLDAHVKRLRSSQPGFDPSRADVVRILLSQALEQVEASAKRKR